MVTFDFTDEEWEAVILELSERMKNCAYIATEDRVRTIVKQIREETYSRIDEGTQLTLTYDIKIFPDGLREIVGGLRRSKDEQKY